MLARLPKFAAAIVATGALLGVCQAAEHSHAGHKHGKSNLHAGHAHDDHHLCEADIEMPKDYAAAVKRIKSCRVAIGLEIAEGHLEEVHQPLDEASVILNKLMPIARASGVPKARWQEVNLAAKDLKKRLDALHAVIDKTGRADFEAVAKPIDSAIARLETVAASLPVAAKRTSATTR